MLIALVWSLAHEPSYFDGVPRPLPTVANTLGAGPIQNQESLPALPLYRPEEDA